MRFPHVLVATGCAIATTFTVLFAEPSPTANPPSPSPTPESSLVEIDSDAMYDLGKSLFDQLAPESVKAEYDFPTRDQWDGFAQRLSSALAGDSLDDLARYEPEARAAGSQLKSLPAEDEYHGWLEQRLDEVAGAREAVQLRSPAAPGPTLAPKGKILNIPYLALWQKRVSRRPLEPSARTLMPRLRAAFAAEGLPPEVAWIAEAESSLNPKARSPAGAKGLFQLTSETAHQMGLSTFLPDQRTNPDASAHAAAKHLRLLHRQFGDWPLALAAYNAGAGRVQRALARSGGSTFAAAANTLPAETRMYVPKVCALIQLRSGVAPEKIPPPK